VSRAFITGWRRETWRDAEDRGEEGEPLTHTASDQFGSRGIQPGDLLYVLGNDDGRLIVIGRMTVEELYGLEEARARLGPDVWDASWHAEGSDGTPKRFDCVVPEDEARQIKGASGKPLRIAPDEYRLDSQTLMTVREITPGSAAILDRLLDEPARDDDLGDVLATAKLGRLMSAAERKAVEERAMTVAEEELRGAGWTTIDRTAEVHSWDFEVGRGTESARVEVKGSTVPITKVELTRNEVESARTHSHSILVLVERIRLDREGPTATGGTAEVQDPWELDEAQLSPERYSYRPRARS
jgi:hypothetical protein